jgi:hypothetical protein
VPMEQTKIFCIGLSGTGTKSLVLALRQMGVSATHLPKSIEQISRYRAAADISVACRYRELDIMFPNSKFILSTREKSSWLDSRARKRLKVKPPPLWIQDLRLRVYGRLAYQPDLYARVYDEFHAGVEAYFAERQTDLLTIDISKRSDYDRVAAFVGKAAKGEGFPMIAKSEDNWTWLSSEYWQIVLMCLRAPARMFSNASVWPKEDQF